MSVFWNYFVDASKSIQYPWISYVDKQLGNGIEQHLFVVTDIRVSLNMSFELSFTSPK